MSRRVFLAHAREDKEQVRKLYRDLKARGFDPWLDEEDLLPGQIWKSEIPKAIGEAGVFLACLSSRSVQKTGYVQNEFRLALNAFGERPPGTIYLIPARLDDCEIPELEIPDRGLSLRDVHWVDLWQERGFEKLVRAIEHAPGITDPPALSEEQAPTTIVPAELEQRTGDAALEPLQVFRDVDAPWCPEMVVIPAGRFLMGSPEGEGYDDERPQHEVVISRAFALGRYTLTFAEYDHFCEQTGRKQPHDQGWWRGRRPAINVSWEDAQACVTWLCKATGRPYRLPSEAEWESACRAGTTTRYAFGDVITARQANFGGKFGKSTEVGSYPANPWGLFDLHGNVWEWCEDRWRGRYKGTPHDGSAWLEGTDSRRVVRGGSWSDQPRNLRSACRNRSDTDDRNYFIGFRVARTLTP